MELTVSAHQLIDDELRFLSLSRSEKRWATRKEACEYLRVGLTTLHSLIRRGAIEARKIGGKTLIDMKTVDEFCETLPRLGSMS